MGNKYVMLDKRELIALLDQLTDMKTYYLHLNKNGIYFNGCLWVSAFHSGERHRGLQTLKKLNKLKQLSGPIT